MKLAAWVKPINYLNFAVCLLIEKSVTVRWYQGSPNADQKMDRSCMAIITEMDWRCNATIEELDRRCNATIKGMDWICNATIKKWTGAAPQPIRKWTGASTLT